MTRKIARYNEIENNLIKKIQSGELKIGDQIMTEKELCEIYKVSRMTVTKALQSLTTKGFIKRIAGKGSFVCDSNVKKIFGHSRSFTQDILSIGQTPGAILIEYRVYRGEEIPEIAQKLRINPKGFIHFFTRIRTADGIKIALSHTYINCDIIPALNISTLEGSLYKYIQDELGISPKVKAYSVNATLPTPEQKKLLEINDTALLKVVHPSFLESGEILEYTETYYVGSRYTYYLYSDNSDFFSL